MFGEIVDPIFAEDTQYFNNIVGCGISWTNNYISL
jgi:hypothetical protein